MSGGMISFIDAVEEKLRTTFTGKVIELSKELISIPTVNPPGTNYKEIVSLLTRVLRDLGFDVREYSVPRDEFSKYGISEGSEDRINVVAVKRFGRGGRKVHIHTHYDVVPPGSGWSKDPFRPVVEGGKLYGRGASDMKCAVAASIYGIKILEELDEELGLDLNGEVLISITPDEETGGLAGAGYLTEKGIIRGVDYTVMPEPTSLTYIWHAHKGCLWYRIRVVGRQAHATLPHLGINAFERMTLLAMKFMEYRKIIGQRVSRFEAYPVEGGKATIAIGGMCGCCDAVNIVPGEAWFTVDRRVLPKENLADVEKEILSIVENFRRNNPGVNIEVKNLLRIEPSYIDPDHELVKLIKESVREALGVDARPVLCPGFLNTRYFIKSSMPAVAWGPGDLGQAHAPNEYIELDKLFKWAKALTVLIKKTMEGWTPLTHIG